MKLLIVSQYFYPEQFRINDVCFSLVQMGHEVTVLTGLPNYPMGSLFDGYHWPEKKEENINGVRVLRCNLRPRKSGKKNLALNYISFAMQGRQSANALLKEILHGQDEIFDHIIVFQYSPVTMALPAIYLKRKLHLPLTLYCFDLWPESIVSAGLASTGLVYEGIKLLSRWIYRQSDQILISSKKFADYFKDKLNITNIPLQYLPIYAEDQFSVSQNKCESKTQIRLLFAGNIGKMQSVETILLAANELANAPAIHIDIVGDGTALEGCKKLAASLQLNNVTFHGRHPLEEMPHFYEAADAFLITLKKDPFISYTLPGKVQSYMAFGKPILAAADGEVFDTISGSGCGSACHAEDHGALAKVMEEFAANPSAHKDYGKASKKYYDAHFSKDAFFSSFLSALKNKWQR